jgi:UDP-2,3-diacylglucosamine hydrolase
VPLLKNPSVKAQSTLFALFASDIHLHPSLPKTTDAFFHFLSEHARNADQLYLLGDLFEYWAGDDDIATQYHIKVIQALRALSDAGTQIFWISGNRDFLIGERFFRETGAQPLPDPSVIAIANHRIAIAHGDEQCTDDLPYMAFRNRVRQEKWQQDFLQLPLAQRKEIIEGLRVNSQMEQKGKTAEIMDVSPKAIQQLFTSNNVDIIIHGHTHRPAKHQHQEGVRYVLPDWDCDLENKAPRGGWLEIYSDGEILFRHLDRNNSRSFSETNY